MTGGDGRTGAELAALPDGDPRRGPFDRDERMLAVRDLAGKRRWHTRKGADWLAVRLQYGRGLAVRDVMKMFGIGDSSIYRRADQEGWVPRMSERDRQRLARRVWLCGEIVGTTSDAAAREALMAASEWRRVGEEAVEPLFTADDPLGEPRIMTVNAIRTPKDIPHDAYFSAADPHRDERRHVCDELDDIIADYERAEREVAEAGAGEAGSGAAEVGDDAGRVGEDRGAGEGVAAEGEGEPASA